MEEGGWMGIHTVCYILQTRRGFKDVCVGDLVTLIHASQGERYELATCRPVPDDEDATKALGCGADVKDVDPLRGKPRMQFDPRDRPYQSFWRQTGGRGLLRRHSSHTGTIGARSPGTTVVRASL